MNHPTRGNRIIFTKQEIGKIPTNGGPRGGGAGGWGGKQETLPKKTEKRKKKKEEVEAKTKIVVSVESGVLELRFGA